jgi:hypothetical protein
MTYMQYNLHIGRFVHSQSFTFLQAVLRTACGFLQPNLRTIYLAKFAIELAQLVNIRRVHVVDSRGQPVNDYADNLCLTTRPQRDSKTFF